MTCASALRRRLFDRASAALILDVCSRGRRGRGSEERRRIKRALARRQRTDERRAMLRGARPRRHGRVSGVYSGAILLQHMMVAFTSCDFSVGPDFKLMDSTGSLSARRPLFGSNGLVVNGMSGSFSAQRIPSYITRSCLDMASPCVYECFSLQC